MATRGKDALDDKGYVVYQRDSHNPRWKKARANQKQIIDSYYSTISTKPTLDQYIQVGEFLMSLGEAEENKERRLIESVIGIEVDKDRGVKEFIEQFNQVLVGAKQYQDATTRLRIALDLGDKAGLAPTISSLYVSRLNKILGERINNYIHQTMKDAKTPEEIDRAIDKMEEGIMEVFEGAFEEALQDLLSYKNTTGETDRFGTGSGYPELLELFNSNPVFKNIYEQKIRKAFSDESIRNIIRQNREKIKKNTRTYGWSWSKKALSFTDARTGQIGGLVNEIFNMLRGSIGDAVVDEHGYHRTSRAITSNKVATDTITLFQKNTQINTEVLDEELFELSKKLDGTEVMAEAHEELMDYWNKYLSKLNDGFVVFQSAKAYRLTNIDKFKGFTNTTVSLNRLQTLPRYGSFKEIDINKLVMIIANTLDGAILSEDYGQIRQWLYMYICESIAYLLFDDWEKIGDEYDRGGANSIHALLLDDINVPMSIFLKSAGSALMDTANEMQDATKFINIVVHRSKILYPNVEDYYNDEDIMIDNPSTQEEKRAKRPTIPSVLMAWNKQRTDTLQNYTITVKFYKNFNEEILNKILGDNK